MQGLWRQVAAATEAAMGCVSVAAAIWCRGGSGYAGDDLIRRRRRHLLACGFGPGSALKAHRAFIHYRTALRAPKGKAFGGDYALRCADSYTQGLWRQIAAATEAAIGFTAVAAPSLSFTSSRPRRRAVSHSIPISLSTSSSVVAQLVAMRLITRPSSSFSQKSSSAPSDRRASVSSSGTTKIWFVGVSMAKR